MGKKRQRAWNASDHAQREDSSRRQRHVEEDRLMARVRRRAQLTHDTAAKRSTLKLQLHITKAKRQLEQLRERLQKWDPVEEAEKRRKAEEERKKAQEPEEPPKKRGRKGPETWKLRGAARPAAEVYDFDTRYVDPHMEAHKKAKKKAQRSMNVLAVYKGKFAEVVAQNEVAREYLAVLMQLGSLSEEAKQFRTARESWLECMELEGDKEPLTTARECLMRMYLSVERYEAALRLGERLATDTSACIRFSAALASHNLSKSDNSMVEAVKCNPFCAFYLAHYKVFDEVFEYTDELEEDEDGPQSSFTEALEYSFNPAVARVWIDSGADVVLRQLLDDVQRGAHKELTVKDLEWSDRLTEIERDYESRSTEDAYSTEDGPDVKMYAGMFRTAMDMLSSSK